MVQITIQIDDDKVNVNQSATPTKVETSATKRYFIVMSHYDDSSWVKLVTEDYTDAINKLKELRYSCKSEGYYYSLFVQEDGEVMPCKYTDWDIDRQSCFHNLIG